MNSKKVITILLIVLVGVILLAVGYASISNYSLNIQGNATATPDDENFKVKFSGTPTSKKSVENATVTTAIKDDLTATLDVSGLSAKGDYITATYTIENYSADLSASLSASQTNSNTEYFDVAYSLAETNIAKGKTTTITVTVTLIKTPIDAEQKTTVNTTVIASPVQPQ